jgi:hypothetical protein
MFGIAVFNSRRSEHAAKRRPAGRVQAMPTPSFPFPSKPIASHPACMNAAQQEVLDKVIELLGEHFDHAVVAVGWYDEDKQYSTTATYSGGVAPALGLCSLYKTKWQKEHLWGADEEE